MGFIDMNKLKHENVVSSENFIPRSERFNKRQLKTNATKPIIEHTKKPDNNNNNNNNIYNKDVEFKADLMNKLVHFVKENENIEFYASTINEFYKELNVITNMTKNTQKNKILLKWEKIFVDRQKLYQKYLIEQQDKERKKRRKEKLRQTLEKHMEQEKMLKIEQEKKFEEELEKIRKKGQNIYDKNNRKSVIIRQTDIKKKLSIGRKGSNVSPGTKSLCSIRSNSSCSINTNKNEKKEKVRIVKVFQKQKEK
jgi:hypothetical protein